MFVRATAGLRLLNAAQQSTLLRSADAAVAAAGFAGPRYELQRARVVGGAEEAVYDFLSVNVAALGVQGLREALRASKASLGLSAKGSSAPAGEEVDVTPASAGDAGAGAEHQQSPRIMYGVMDLGGASTQIAFVARATAGRSDSDDNPAAVVQRADGSRLQINSDDEEACTQVLLMGQVHARWQAFVLVPQMGFDLLSAAWHSFARVSEAS